jgi:tetratricopeptide (TPR) repeat protein
MAPKQRVITRQELNQAETLSTADLALVWLQRNSSVILTLITVALLGFAGFRFYEARMDAVHGEKTDVLYTAYREFDGGLQHQWGSPERVAAMGAARKAAEELRAKAGDSPIGREALFLIANTFYFEGDTFAQPTNTQEAIKRLQEFDTLARANGDPMEIATAMLALGYANENMWLLTSNNEEVSRNHLVSALDIYTRMEKEIGDKAGFLLYEALNAKARILTVFGQREEAIQLYKRVYKERRYVLSEPESQSRRQMLLYQLQQLAGQFTAAASARIALVQMGVDVEALDKELDAAKKAAEKKDSDKS